MEFNFRGSRDLISNSKQPKLSFECQAMLPSRLLLEGALCSIPENSLEKACMRPAYRKIPYTSQFLPLSSSLTL